MLSTAIHSLELDAEERSANLCVSLGDFLHASERHGIRIAAVLSLKRNSFHFPAGENVIFGMYCPCLDLYN